MNFDFNKYQRLLKKQSKWEKEEGVSDGDFTKLSDKKIDEWLKIEREIENTFSGIESA